MSLIRQLTFPIVSVGCSSSINENTLPFQTSNGWCWCVVVWVNTENAFSALYLKIQEKFSRHCLRLTTTIDLAWVSKSFEGNRETNRSAKSNKCNSLKSLMWQTTLPLVQTITCRSDECGYLWTRRYLERVFDLAQTDIWLGSAPKSEQGPRWNLECGFDLLFRRRSFIMYIMYIILCINVCSRMLGRSFRSVCDLRWDSFK